MAGVAVLTGGCAERRLVARPETAPGPGTWTAVWLAGGLLVIVVGVLLTLPVWRERGGARVAAAVLTLQTGAVAVVGTVLIGVAVRSWQLLDRPADAPASVALLRLSRVDGDTAFFALMVLLLIVGVGLVTMLSALAARFAASTDTWERWAASVVIAVELGGSGVAAGALLLGARGWPYLAPTLAAPVLAAALATCWPRRPAALR